MELTLKTYNNMIIFKTEHVVKMTNYFKAEISWGQLSHKEIYVL